MPIAAIPNVHELHIGHSIVSHSVLVGFSQAVSDMVAAIREGDRLAGRYSPSQILRQFTP